MRQANADRRQTGTATSESAFGPRFVAAMMLGSALNPINSSIIATALVAIAAGLGVSVGQTSILVTSLYLTSAVAQPTAGRLAEQLGPRRVFMAGTLLVLVGGIVGGLGENLAILAVARVLIGLGTSTGYPTAMLLIRRRASAAGLAESPRTVLGSLAVAAAATVAVGPALGGVLISWFDWRAAFFINVPIGCVAFLMAAFWIAKDADPRVGGNSYRELLSKVDVVGVMGFGVTLTAVLVFLLSLPRARWMALGVSVLMAIVLIWWELRARHPFLDIRLLLSNLALTRTYIRNGVTLLGVYAVLYGLTQWVEAARGLTAYEAGLALIPMGVLSALSAQIVSRRFRMGTTLIAAAVLMLTGALITLCLNSHSPVGLIIMVMALFGMVSGCSTVANQTALYGQAPEHTVATASGLLRTFGYIGSVAASTLCGVLFRTHVTDVGLHSMSLVLIAVSAMVLLLTSSDRKLYMRRATRDPRTRFGGAWTAAWRQRS